MKYFTRRKNSLTNQYVFFYRLLLSVFLLAIGVDAANAKNSDAEIKEETVVIKFNARNVFKNLDCSALELLPISTRLDMLDYWDVDSVYKALNALGGVSSLDTITDNYLKVRISAVSSLQIKILPIKKSVIAMTVYTVGDDSQATDSELKFYDMELNEIPADKHFDVPEVKDFFEIPKGSQTSMKEIEDMIPFPTIEYSASPDNNNLTARLTVEKYINQDDWNIAKLFVKPYIILDWKKDKFKYHK